MDVLQTARADALAQISALTAVHDELVAASVGSNADDEHDPEGATIAFERQQVLALLDQARATLAQVETALDRASSGDYGRCEACGGDIGSERLAARPSATLCIVCARREPSRR